MDNTGRIPQIKQWIEKRIEAQDTDAIAGMVDTLLETQLRGEQHLRRLKAQLLAAEKLQAERGALILKAQREIQGRQFV